MNQRKRIDQVQIREINGEPWRFFTLTNEHGMEVKITNLGGIITSLKVPDKFNNFENIVLNYENVEAYLNNEFYLGALVGRFANRIAKGVFDVEGTTYELIENNGPNHLHGGKKGFDQVLWKSEVVDGSNYVGLRLTYFSKDGEEGYPGNLDVQVCYKLTDKNEFQIEYKASTDKATPVNLTQHSYFNLSGQLSQQILNQELTVNADYYLPIDAHSIPFGYKEAVENTPFDFRKSRSIGSRIYGENMQLENASGYDHNFVLNKKSGKKLGLAAKLFDANSGRLLEVYTTKPGMQLYTGNFLNEDNKEKTKQLFDKRCGLCLETQHFPNAPNEPDFPSSILYPGEVYEETTIFKFLVLDQN